MKTKLALSAIIALAVVTSVDAADTQGKNDRQQAQEYSSTGKILAVTRLYPPAGSKATWSKATGVTVAHDAVAPLGMPAMTMDLDLGSPRLVSDVGKGDSVTFRFVPRGDRYVVTHVEKAKS